MRPFRWDAVTLLKGEWDFLLFDIFWNIFYSHKNIRYSHNSLNSLKIFFKLKFSEFSQNFLILCFSICWSRQEIFFSLFWMKSYSRSRHQMIVAFVSRLSRVEFVLFLQLLFCCRHFSRQKICKRLISTYVNRNNDKKKQKWKWKINY